MAQKRVALYLRVSTDGQTVENQRRDLVEACEARGWGIVEVFADEGISGAKTRAERPGLDAALRFMERGKADVLATWAVDRLGRSLQDLVSTLGALVGARRDLFILKQQVDTTTPAGRAMFQMLGVFSEFEREMIRERVNSGLDRARAAGKTLGRPRSPHDDAIRAQLAQGVGMNRVARIVGVGTSTVQRVAQEMKAEAAA